MPREKSNKRMFSKDICSELDKLIELEKTLTQMFDSDVRVAMALLEEIRKIKNK